MSWELLVASRTHLEAERAKKHTQRASKTQVGSFEGPFLEAFFVTFPEFCRLQRFLKIELPSRRELNFEGPEHPRCAKKAAWKILCISGRHKWRISRGGGSPRKGFRTVLWAKLKENLRKT